MNLSGEQCHRIAADQRTRICDDREIARRSLDLQKLARDFYLTTSPVTSTVASECRLLVYVKPGSGPSPQ
jgi:hypothetical protein